VVREVFEAFAQRDVEALEQLLDPEMEFFAPTAELAHGGEPYRGSDGIKRYFEDVERTWEEIRVVPQAFREAGDHVLVSGRVYARGRGGFLVDSPTNWVWRLREGLVIWGRVYDDRDEALRAAGLTD
jgi:ketosteroid isomerase-like protein